MKARVRRLVMVAITAFLLVGVLASAAPAYAQGSWYAEYYPNRDLAGGPALTRYEGSLNFDWGHGSPGPGIPNDNFSARFTRSEWFEAGTYRFSYRSDDGIRIWVGGTLVVDDWRERQAYWSSIDHFVPRGTHSVRVEYFEQTGTAVVQAGWERITGGKGYRGEYYSNRDLAGSPVLIRDDAAIDFSWGTGSPDPAVPADNFSVRWTRSTGFLAGTYRFYASCDDGVRIYVDGALVVDAWFDQKLPNTRHGDRYLADGQHSIVVAYYEHGGDAAAHVWWDRLGSFAGWEGRYYDNKELRGGPTMIRDDAEINFDWGEGPAAPWMPSDHFSAMWRRQVYFSPGYYRFNVRSDDGFRVWLGDRLLMDYWGPLEYQWHYVDGTYLEGWHPITVKYYEETGFARIRFWWEPSITPPSPGDGAPPPTPGPPVTGPFQGEYFNNQNLSGTPVLVRSDPAIDYNWGWGEPGPGVNQDHFSVRWTGAFPFEVGQYRFRTYTDDGVRLYVDDRLLINAWYPMRGTRVRDYTPGAGNHTVRVEYFERTQVARAHVTWTSAGAAPGAPSPPARPPVAPACPSGPLTLEAWAVSTRCVGGGWEATVFVRGRGGDCRYTYAWEQVIKGGPTSGSMTFNLWSSVLGAMVGNASVTSAGQTAKVGLYIRPPDDCH